MLLTITIKMDNAAFTDNPSESARILRDLAVRIDAREVPAGLDDHMHLRDINGNIVGGAAWINE